MPNIRWLLALITRVQRFLYLRTGGVIGASIFGVTMLLLTTVGRRSGSERTTPLLYIEDGERLVVIGSNAGDHRHPAWWLNLQAQPRARVQIRKQRFDVVARRADPAETERLWPRLVAAYAYFDRYREKSRRDIPVILLERSPVA
jgi:deazaflavin-dependent oxidoreductase (nitroreductase family)